VIVDGRATCDDVPMTWVSRTHRAVGIVVITATALLGSAFDSFDDAGASAQTASGDPAVTLLDAGKGAKAALRMAYTDGAESRTAMSFRMTLVQVLEGTKLQDVDTGTLALSTVVHVGTVAADGSAPVEYTYEGIHFVTQPTAHRADGSTLGADDAQAMEASMQEFEKVRSSGTVDARNQMHDLQLVGAEDVSAATRAEFEQFGSQVGGMAMAPLPAEPVGIGARWRVDTYLDSNGIHVKQSTTYTLRERDHDQVVLTYTAKQSVPKQRIEVPGLPAGAKVTNKSWRVTGRGRTVIGLHQALMPLQAKGKLGGTQELGVHYLGDDGTLLQRVTAAVTIG
jgi:hypothetical protein